jgi:phosphatidylglycerol:prolipoprotein diacylglycerol transferase
MPLSDLFLAGPYNTALIAAVVVGLVLAIRAGTRAGFAPLAWQVLLVAALAGGLIGSTFIFLDFHAPRPGEKSNLGGLIAGIAVVILLATWLRIGALRALDTMALPTLVAMAIGRVGCFLAGCCAGTHTGLPWGAHVDGEPGAIHPVQLYEAAADMTLVALLARWVPTSKPGTRLGFAVVSYAGIRFATEFVRAGRTDVAGLNPVQWSMLAISVGIALWMWRRSVAHAVVAPRAIATNIDAQQRAVVVATVMALSAVTVVMVLPQLLAPFEAVFVVVLSCGLAAWALIRYTPRGLARPLMPTVCALFLLDAPADSVGRKKEVLVGGGIWTGRDYSTVVGENRSLYTDCNGAQSIRINPTYAKRRSLTGWFSGGFRGRTAAGRRITVEGQLIAGKDKLQRLDEGDLFAPVSNSTSIFAGGGVFTLEGKNQHLRVSALGGELSNSGVSEKTLTGSVTGRHGVEGGLYVEGNFALKRYYASTGDFSYAGVGVVLNPNGARALIGVGEGGYFGVHVPVRSFELDMTLRTPFNTDKVQKGSSTLSVGLKKAFTIH